MAMSSSFGTRFWPFFSTHTNGLDPANLREQGARFADLLAVYVEQTNDR